MDYSAPGGVWEERLSVADGETGDDTTTKTTLSLSYSSHNNIILSSSLMRHESCIKTLLMVKVVNQPSQSTKIKQSKKSEIYKWFLDK